MKKTALIVLLYAFVSSPATASDWRDECERADILAQIVMEARQNGKAMADVIKAGNGNEAIEYFVIAAYEKPRYQSAETQKQAIQDFRDAIYKACIKKNRK